MLPSKLRGLLAVVHGVAQGFPHRLHPMPAVLVANVVDVLESQSATIDDNLIYLTEECAEVIQAATKCIRFGFFNGYPGYGWNNEILSAEIGDLLGVIDLLPIDGNIVREHRRTKKARLEKAKMIIPRKPGENLNE